SLHDALPIWRWVPARTLAQQVEVDHECTLRMRDEKEETMSVGRLQGIRGRQHRVIAAVLFSLLSAAASASAQNTFPASGNVGIGTSTPGYQLDVIGSLAVTPTSGPSGQTFLVNSDTVGPFMGTSTNTAFSFIT